MPSPFNQRELDTLRSHEIVIVRDRVIFEAEPPIDAATLAWVQERCSGPLPRQLLELWSITAGGSLDYDATITMGGFTQSFSWNELFSRGANTYRDLNGWIESEMEVEEEVAAERGTSFKGTLDWVPIGGFEYCDRVYVRTVQDDNYGAVGFWIKGLPPGWRHRMQRDGFAWFAPDLYSAFDRLYLAEHPVHGPSEYKSGNELQRFVRRRVEQYGLKQRLADRLMEFYERAVLDWKTPLADGSIVGHMPAVKAAFAAALHNDDADLVARVGAAGVTFVEPLSGSALATDLAVMAGCNEIVKGLLALGSPVDTKALDGLHENLRSDIVEALIAGGAEPTPDQAAEAVAMGSQEVARVLLAAFALRQGSGANVQEQCDDAWRRALVRHETALSDHESGKVHNSGLGAQGLAERIERLNSFTP